MQCDMGTTNGDSTVVTIVYDGNVVAVKKGDKKWYMTGDVWDEILSLVGANINENSM